MNNGNAERVILEADPEPTVQGVARANAALDSFTAKGANAGKGFEAAGGLMVRTSQSTRTSVERLTSSVEKLAATYGKTGTERLIAQRDQMIARLGNEEKAIGRVRTAYDKMIAVEAAGGGGLGAKIRDAIQNPLQAAGNAAESFVTKFGAVGIAVSVGAVAIGAAAKAGWDWAKNLGSMGAEIEHTAERMGLTVQEEERFRFAMNRSGGDMGTLENIMRKLSQEIEGGGENLTKMGVRFRDVQTAELQPMSQTILELSQRLADMPAGPIRNAEAIRVMGRSALEVLPYLLELSEGVKKAGELNIGWGPDDVKKAAGLRKEIAGLTAQWDYAVMKFKQPIAAVVVFTITGIDKLQMILKLAEASGKIALGMGPKTFPDQGPQQSAADARRALAVETGSIARNDAAIRARLESTLEEQLSAAKSKLADEAKKLPAGVMYDANRFKEFDAQKKIVTDLEARVEATKKLEAAVKQLEAAEKQAALTTLGPVAKAFAEHEERLKSGVSRVRSLNVALVEGSAALAKAEEENRKQLLQISHNPPSVQEFLAHPQQFAGQGAGIPGKELKAELDQYTKFMDSAVKEFEDDSKRREKEWLEKNDVRKWGERQISDIGTAAAHRERMGELAAAPGQELAALQQGYALRVQAAQQEFAIVAAHDKLYDMDEQRWKLQKEMQAAGYEYEEKVAELQKSRFEKLQSSMEGLLDAAFARSKSILDALKGMAEAVFLTPIKQGISSMMANALMPMMYGKDGSGGIMGRISGIFGGGGINGVRLVNGAVPVVVMGAGGSGGGGGSYALPAAAGLAGLLSAPAAMAKGGEVIGAGGSTAGLTRLASGLWDRSGGMGVPMGGGMAAVSEIVGGPGGTSGFAGPVGGYGGAVQASSGGIGGWAKSASGFSGFKGMLSGLGNIGMGSRPDLDEAGNPIMVSTGKGVGGVAGGAMLLGGGTLVAAGIKRGGYSGLMMDAAGGALIGAKFGGPVGAVVGGLIGAGIGVARLFIKSAAEKVMEKVKTIYGLTIDKKFAQQIVDLANQKYGKNLDMAVRAPETRDLLRLYAQTVGVKVPSSLMADVARPASLVESRGQLYQQAIYENGAAYAYPSYLKTYGGVQAQNIPTASPYAGGGNVTLIMNGQSAADVLEGRAGSYISGNPRAVSASALRGNAATNSRAGNAVLTLAPSVITQ